MLYSSFKHTALKTVKNDLLDLIFLLKTKTSYLSVHLLYNLLLFNFNRDYSIPPSKSDMIQDRVCMSLNLYQHWMSDSLLKVASYYLTDQNATNVSALAIHQATIRLTTFNMTNVLILFKITKIFSIRQVIPIESSKKKGFFLLSL